MLQVQAHFPKQREQSGIVTCGIGMIRHLAGDLQGPGTDMGLGSMSA